MTGREKTPKPKEVNQLDRYLALENILPHQNTLARGYQQGYYEYVSNGGFGGQSPSN